VKFNRILIGHVLDRVKDIPDESIDMCITSPPYWGLRDYGGDTIVVWGDKDCKHEWGSDIIKQKTSGGQKETNLFKGRNLNGINSQKTLYQGNHCIKCNAWKGQLGLEPTFNLFVEHLVQIFEAIKPKLTKMGTLWVNLGDTYSGGGGLGVPQGVHRDTILEKWDLNEHNQKLWKTKNDRYPDNNPQAKLRSVMGKSLIGIPDRFKIAMIDKGWICRNEIIWHKPSCMPSSATDRFTVDFEKLFFFSKNKKYYFKQQFDPIKEESIKRLKRGVSIQNKLHKDNTQTGLQPHTVHNERTNDPNRETPNTRNKRTVWSINPKGFKEAHFAVFPEELIKVPIDAGCPEKVCTKCNKPIETKYEVPMIKNRENTRKDKRLIGDNTPAGVKKVERPPSDAGTRPKTETIISCDCNAEFRKGVVLDPFMGSGTTAIVANKQGKDWLGIELNPEYVKIAKKRIAKYGSNIYLTEFF